MIHPIPGCFESIFNCGLPWFQITSIAKLAIGIDCIASCPCLCNDLPVTIVILGACYGIVAIILYGSSSYIVHSEAFAVFASCIGIAYGDAVLTSCYIGNVLCGSPITPHIRYIPAREDTN